MKFSHLDEQRRPTMVDVSDKRATARTATAESRVVFPMPVADALRASDLRSAKGPVFDTAIVAGVMAAKRTHELIPFCHPLGLESCRVVIELVGDTAVIRCTVRVHDKTGVEMEALTGASIAALTVYDMCKALSHEIVVAETRLLSKDKGSFAPPLPLPLPPPPLWGLVLAGGESSRMHRDKAGLTYAGQPQLDRAFELLSRHVASVFVSVRSSQSGEPSRAQYPLIVDSVDGRGPIAGIRSALSAQPGTAWLVLACDLPFLTDAAVARLIAERDPKVLATAYASAHDGKPEPLCAIWEPAARFELEDAGRDTQCPRKFLSTHAVKLVDPLDRRALDNINTPDEYTLAEQALATTDSPSDGAQFTIRYFALLREQAGRSEEVVRSTAATAADLFAELSARHRFTLARDQLKVAVNAEFTDWTHPLTAGDAVVFIPPVAGG